MGKIFLAHSGKDKESYINSVVTALQKDIGRNTFVYDMFDFNKKIDLEKQIKQALSKTSIFIVFLTANSIESEWVRFEIDEAIELYGENISVICGINITSQNFEEYLKNIISNRAECFIEEGKDVNETVRIIKKYYNKFKNRE